MTAKPDAEMVMVPKEFLDFIKNQQDLPADFRKVLNDHYWELLAPAPAFAGGETGMIDMSGVGNDAHVDPFLPAQGETLPDSVESAIEMMRFGCPLDKPAGEQDVAYFERRMLKAADILETALAARGEKEKA